MYVKFFMLLLLMVHFQLMLAQNKNYTQTVRGIVIDAGTQSPLAGAGVSVEGLNPPLFAISDENGEFIIQFVPLGIHNLNISLLGYKPLVLSNMNVKSGKELVLEIELEEMLISIPEIEIKAQIHKEKPLNEMAQISARSFTVEETERYAGTWLDPARMASNFAGVMTAGDQRNDIIIRGNSPLGLLWRLEGIDIPNPNHFGTLGTTGGPISILNNNLLSNSDFFTSAFPAEYGNAISGVFDLNLRNGNNKTPEFVAQIGMNGFELGAEGPFSKSSKSSYLVSYRYSTLQIFDALGISFGVSGIPEYHDISFKLNIPDTKPGRFSIFGIGGKSFIELMNKNRKADDWSFGRNKLDMRFGSDMGIIGLSHVYFLNQNTRIKSIFAISFAGTSAKADSAYEDKPSINSYGDKSSEIKYSFSTRLIRKINAKNNYSLGISSDVFDVSFVDSMLAKDYTYLELTNAHGTSVLLQSFVQWQHKFSDKLVLYSGMHFQYFSLNGSRALEPRASLKYQIAESQNLSLGFGFHSQLQPRLFYFLQTVLPDGSIEKTNLSLEFSKSYQMAAGYDFSFSKNFRIKVEAYYQYLHQIPVEQRLSTFSIINYGSEFYSERADSLINKGSGTNYGIELTLEKFLGKNYYFLFTLSVFESKYRASDGIWRNTSYNGRYVGNFLSGYTFKIGQHNSLSVDLKVVYAGGKYYIPVDLEKSKAKGIKVLDYQHAYEPQYPPYFRIDNRLSFKLNREKFNLEMAFDLQNITNHQNILLETWDVDSQSIKYDYQLGLFYVFLLRFQF